MKIKKWRFSLLIVILCILGLSQKVDGAIQTIDPYSFYQGSDLILTDTYDKAPTITAKGFVREENLNIAGDKLVSPSILYRYSNANKGIAADAYIEVHYYGIGNYGDQKIDAVVKFHNILFNKAAIYLNVYPNTPANDSFFKLSYNLYRGFNFVNIRDFENNITFQYQDGTKLPISADNPIYLSFNSLNKDEYIGIPKHIWYCGIPNNNVLENLTGSRFNILKGINSNFPDGHPELLDFYKNSVIAKFCSPMNTIVLGSDYGEAWLAYSAKLLWVPEPIANQPSITKSVTDDQDNDLNQKLIFRGDTVNWQVKFKVESLDKMPLKYKSLIITDKLDTHLSLTNEPTITNSTGEVVPENHYSYDAIQGTLTFNTTGLENLDYKGGNYTITYPTIIKTGLPGQNIKNKAKIQYNDVASGQFESNEVNVIINQHAELNLQRIEIDTAKANSGLPVRVNVDKKATSTIADQETFILNLYNQATNQKVYSWGEIKVSDLPLGTTAKTFSGIIPSHFLTANQKQVYEARIENFNSNRVTLVNGKLETEGYTAVEKNYTTMIDTIGNQTGDSQGATFTFTKNQAIFKGIVQTAHEQGQAIQRDSETIAWQYAKIPNTKSGYGFERKLTTNYAIGGSRAKENINFAYDLVFDKALVERDTYVPHTTLGSQVKIPLECTTDVINTCSVNQIVELPKVQAEKMSGTIFTDEQVKNHDSRITAGNTEGFRDAGRRLYTPIWAKIKKYDVDFQSTQPMGINAVNVRLKDNVNVYAQLWVTIDSTTQKYDELMIIPVFPETYQPPVSWSESATAWLRDTIKQNTDWHGTKYILNTDGVFEKE